MDENKKCESFFCDLPGRYTDPSLNGRMFCQHHRRREIDFLKEQEITKLKKENAELRRPKELGLISDRMIQVPFKVWDKMRVTMAALERELRNPEDKYWSETFKSPAYKIIFSHKDFKEVKEINKMIRDFQKG